MAETPHFERVIWIVLDSVGIGELPDAADYGDVGRDTIVGPTTFGLNGSAGRVFRVGERKNIDLRFDGNNILNHVNFGSYNTTVGSTQFGILQSPNAMRSFSATLRFRF